MVAAAALTTFRDGSRGCRRRWGEGEGNGGCIGDKINNQLNAEMAVVVMATATTTSSGTCVAVAMTAVAAMPWGGVINVGGTSFLH